LIFGLGAGDETLVFKGVLLPVVEDNQKRDPRRHLLKKRVIGQMG